MPSAFRGVAFDFSGRSVVVTGGTRGIGQALAEAYEHAGATLLITGTRQERINELNGEAESAGRKRVSYQQVDFADEESVSRFINVLVRLPKLDVLVNNAGINRLDLVKDVSAVDYETVLRVNLGGPFRCCQVAAQRMAESNYGRILNIASIWSIVTRSKRAAYTISKTGLVGLTRAMAVELADRGVMVNSLSPGFTATELTRSTMPPEERMLLAKQIPAGRFAEPSELSPVALFLTSEANSYMTGQNIVVDGGFVHV